MAEVDRRLRGKGAGERLLMNALRKALDASREVASVAVGRGREMKDGGAISFHRRYGLISFADQAQFRAALPCSRERPVNPQVWEVENFRTTAISEKLDPDARPGIAVSIATAGDLLQWHPYPHAPSTGRTGPRPAPSELALANCHELRYNG